jgi:hypothetical protein
MGIESLDGAWATIHRISRVAGSISTAGKKKNALNKRYTSIRVKLGNVYLYRQNGIITFFTQARPGGLISAQSAVSYPRRQHSIYAEDYHRPVDDSFRHRLCWPEPELIPAQGELN